MFRKYYESGYSVIPLYPNTKRPMIDRWTKYCTELPSEEQIDRWDEKFEKGECGIGVCLGPASNLIALDIDTDDAHTYQVAQKSPVSKRGAKGETRFFKYHKDIENNSAILKSKGIEVLSVGRQTVLPPTVHPITKTPYKWTSQLDLLSIDQEDLEYLDLNLIEQLPNISEKSSENKTPGRNVRLVEIVSAMRTRGESETDIINEVINYDKTHHSPRLFLDSSEGFSGETEDDAKNNAWLFVSRVTQSLIKKNLATLPFKIEIVDGEEFNIKPKTFEYRALPKLNGFIQRFVSLVVAASKGRTDIVGLGGALSVLSTLASNRFRVGSTWPNLYILNIAGSGFGKGAPQQLSQLMLQGSGLLGSGNYRSGASMYCYLPIMQERLDVIDEASMLFRSMKNGDTWQAEMQEILCTLFSCSNSYYAGVTLKGASNQKVKSMNDGACYNPCVNLLASTTPQGFAESFDKVMSYKGLLPRFLIFNQHDVGSWKPFVGFRPLENEVNDLKLFCNDLLRFEKKVLIDTTKADPEKGEQNIGKKYDPFDYPVSPQGKNLLLQFDKHYFDLAKKDDTELYGVFYNRFCELAIKLSLLIALSDSKSEIDIQSVQSAIDIVETQFHNATLLRDSLASGNKVSRHDVVDNVASFIKKRGQVYRSRVYDRFRHLTTKEFDEIIKRLMLFGEITEKKTKGGASRLLYVGAERAQMSEDALQ